MDYSITWKYIVEAMKSKYGFAPDNTERLSYGELKAYMDGIWDDWYELCEKVEAAREGLPTSTTSRV